MSIQEKLKHEVKSLALTTLYFAVWIGALVAFKRLVLAEYHIQYRGMSAVVVGALVLSKVVLLLEHVSLGAWTRTRPAWTEALLRTALYGVGVVVALLIERGFEGRHEHGGFGSSLAFANQHRQAHHVWANALCISGALLGYNALSVIRRHLGEGGLIRIFASPPPG